MPWHVSCLLILRCWRNHGYLLVIEMDMMLMCVLFMDYEVMTNTSITFQFIRYSCVVHWLWGAGGTMNTSITFTMLWHDCTCYWFWDAGGSMNISGTLNKHNNVIVFFIECEVLAELWILSVHWKYYDMLAFSADSEVLEEPEYLESVEHTTILLCVFQLIWGAGGTIHTSRTLKLPRHDYVFLWVWGAGWTMNTSGTLNILW